MANEQRLDTVYLFFLLVAKDQCNYLEQKQNKIFMRIGLEESSGSSYSFHSIFICILEC